MNYFETYTIPQKLNADISSVKSLLLRSDGENLTGLWIGNQQEVQIQKNKPGAWEHVPVFDAVKEWLDIYFTGQTPDFVPPLKFTEGSEFRQTVWQLLLEIPFGEVTTYGELAKKMAEKLGKSKMSAQAVGGAVGHNPISIIVPCHRVVGGNGSLIGYGGGLYVKEYLLNLEGLDMTKFYMPKKSRFLDVNHNTN